MWVIIAIAVVWWLCQKPPTTNDSASGRLGNETEPDATMRTQDELAPGVGASPLTQQDARYGYSTPDWGRPDGLGASPGQNLEGMASQAHGDCGCGCGGGCGGRTRALPDIFSRGRQIGVSPDNLQIVRSRGG